DAVTGDEVVAHGFSSTTIEIGVRSGGLTIVGVADDDGGGRGLLLHAQGHVVQDRLGDVGQTRRAGLEVDLVGADFSRHLRRRHRRRLGRRDRGGRGGGRRRRGRRDRGGRGRGDGRQVQRRERQPDQPGEAAVIELGEAAFAVFAA